MDSDNVLNYYKKRKWPIGKRFIYFSIFFRFLKAVSESQPVKNFSCKSLTCFKKGVIEPHPKFNCEYSVWSNVTYKYGVRR